MLRYTYIACLFINGLIYSNWMATCFGSSGYSEVEGQREVPKLAQYKTPPQHTLAENSWTTSD